MSGCPKCAGIFECDCDELAASERSLSNCERCDEPGGRKTYDNQVSMNLNGKVQCIDWCIHRIVAALNAGGIETTMSCCGHGRYPGTIHLADGRVLKIEAENEN